MSRHKWYRAKWSITMRELGMRIKKTSFKPDASDGFVLDRVRDHSVDARFVEKIDVRQTITDPFGGAVEFDRVEYRQWRFRASNEYPGLELIGSSRGAAGLAYRLAELADHRLVISNFNVDVVSWLNTFNELDKSPGIIDLMQIGKIELGNSIVGRSIIRGSEDVRGTIATFLRDRSYTIEKIQFRLNGSPKRSIVFSWTGGVVLNVVDEDRVIEDVRKALEIISRE